MTWQTVGVRFRCDGCLVTAEVSGPLKYDYDYFNQAVPDGWTSLDALSVNLKDFYGGMLLHLCVTCSSLAIGQLVTMLRERQQKEREASRGYRD